MSDRDDPTASAIRRTSARFARVALVAVFALLAGTLLLAPAAAPWLADRLFAAALALLLSVPVVNVISELVDECQRRDWIFVGAAALVLALIGWTAITKLG